MQGWRLAIIKWERSFLWSQRFAEQPRCLVINLIFSQNESTRIGRRCWTLLQGWSIWTVPKAWVLSEFRNPLVYLCSRDPSQEGKLNKWRIISSNKKITKLHRYFLVIYFDIQPKNESTRIGRSCWTLLQGWSNWTVPKAWI